MSKTINQLTEDTSPTSDDYVATWDVATGTTKKVSLANIKSAVNQSLPYKFSCYRNSALNSASGAFAIITFDTELFDTNNNYATGTGLYTVPVSGFYRFSGAFQIVEAGGGGHRIIAALYKNGTEYYRGNDFQNRAANNGDALNGIIVTPPMQLTAGDTIGFYAFTSGILGFNVGASPIYAYFGGYLLSLT